MEILAIVVRYKIGMEDSETIKGLSNEFRRRPDLLNKIGVIIWDNSPVPIEDPQLPFPFYYCTSGKNLGVSGAYNRGADMAIELNCPWLLLLDQDTDIPSGFLLRMLEYSHEMQYQSEVAAVVPFLLDNGKVTSPCSLWFGKSKLLVPPFNGVCHRAVVAANSGTLMRIKALKSIGGFNEDFWLDFSDVVLHTMLYRNKWRVYVAKDLLVPHKMTISDLEHKMSSVRYLNLITAEGACWDLYRSAPMRAAHTTRLLWRGIKQYVRFKNKIFSKITFAYLFYRLGASRKQRLLLWKAQSQMRSMPVILD